MRIKRLEVDTADPEGTLAFYGSKLRLPLLENTGSAIVFALPHSILCFRKIKKRHPVYHIAFNIPCNKTEEALAWVDQRAPIIPVDEKNIIADFSAWKAKAFYFLDNNSNILECIARDPLQNASDVAFSEKDFLSVSEAGIVCSNVSKTCRQLNERFGIPYYSRQKPGEHFAAMGDDSGLLIGVSEDRPWFPTEERSEKHPFRIELEWDKVKHSLSDKDFA